MGSKEVAIVETNRTPFAKAYGAYRDLDPQTLLNRAVQGLISKSGIDTEIVDEVLAGTVLAPPTGPNMAREVVIDLNLPKHISGFTLGRACASSLQTTISGAEGILSGQYQTAISCGVEALSNVPVLFSKPVVDALIDLKKVAKAKSIGGKFSTLSDILAGVSLKDLKPNLPAIAERSTGKTMGAHAEMMAKINEISREAQDDWTFESHKRAAAAIKDGRLAEEISPIPLSNDQLFEHDDGVRMEPDREALGKLRPVFDRKHGTVSAGNSSPLTDGASACLLMDHDKAKALGLSVLGILRGWKTIGLDPTDQLLIAPAIATPMALDMAKVPFSEIGLWEVHEAFAAQVLSFTQKMASKSFHEKYLGKSEATGEIDPSLMNVNGGSISIGHPFGATGVRIIGALVHEMKRRNTQWGVATACAAGALGTTVVIERV